MNTKLYSIAALLAVLALNACSSDGNDRREEYLDADYYTRLELPPDLTAPEDKRQLSSPSPSDRAVEKFRRDSEDVGRKNEEASTSVPVAIRVKGARLQAEEGIFWLEVDENVDRLWPQLSGFFDNEGIRVVRNEPMLGVLETDWVSKYQGDQDAGFFKKMFSSLEPDKLDKFRMRVEPDDNGATRIFLSHSGLEVVVEGDDISWRSRCSEEELEREMLNRLALYVGLDPTQAKKAFENYRPYASRVKLPEDEANVLYVTGTMNFVWKRSLRALDRLGVEVLEMDSTKREIAMAIEGIDREQLGEERDELAESSWLMRWFSGTDDVEDAGGLGQFKLRLDSSDGVVRITILQRNGEPAETVLAEQFRKALALELQ